MSGLMKAKKYDWKDTNMANFGSEEEREVKKESAEQEPAWEGAGQAVGLKVWRIEKFEVKEWPESDYGKFYSGDSYVILNTYQEEGEDALKYDVHFWIGAESTQDEYGTAAYKTVELDTLLDDAAVQHREVQGHESNLFKSYFKTMTEMRGGCATGFNHVDPADYQPRLLLFRRVEDNVYVAETPRHPSKVQSGDVYILDLGEELIQWNGEECNKDEKFKAAQYCQQIESERGGCSTEVVEQADCPSGHKFYDNLNEELDGDDEDETDSGEHTKKLFRLSNASGSMEFELMKEGEEVSADDLCPNDAFVLDAATGIFVWVGGEASNEEKRKGMQYAHLYGIKNNCSYKPVSILKQGQKNADFDSAIAA